MINIIEREHERIGGNTSLFISFNDAQNFEQSLTLIKALETKNYNKKTKEWEVSLKSLAYLLDNLTFLDDINYKIIEPKEESNLTYNYPEKVTSKLLPHQLEGVNYCLNKKKCLVLDEPGLGKTILSIALAEDLRKRGEIEHCLIICGINSLKTNWEREIHKHTTSDCIIIGKKVSKTGTVSYATVNERARQLIEPIKEFYVIINVEMLISEAVVNAVVNSKNKFGLIVLDEAHKVKSHKAQRTQGILEFNAPYMLGLSGSLLMNSPLDLLMPFTFIGKEPHKNVTHFKETYCTMDETHRVVGYKNLDLLKEELESCSIRRTKNIIKDLPPKTIIDEVLEMNNDQAKFYNDVKKGVKEECDKIDLKPNNLLALCTRLRQATSCPSVLTTQDISNIKIERALELTKEIVEAGDKVVIFSNFKEPLYRLFDLLKEYNPLLNTGDQKDSDVSDNVDRFQNEDKYKVFLGSVAKIGTGLTLNRACYAIFLDIPWTYANYIQAMDRIYRVNNTKPVFIYNLMCEGTMDELVNKIVNRKQALSDYVVDKKETDEIINILTKFVKGI